MQSHSALKHIPDAPRTPLKKEHNGHTSSLFGVYHHGIGTSPSSDALPCASEIEVEASLLARVRDPGSAARKHLVPPLLGARGLPSDASNSIS